MELEVPWSSSLDFKDIFRNKPEFLEAIDFLTTYSSE